MRSKEVEKAIDDFNFFNEGEYITKEMAESKETLLSYISKLEKENENYRKLHINIQGMRNGKQLLTLYINDSILKDVIRDKIKELEENGYWDFLENRDLEYTIKILKELLGE